MCVFFFRFARMYSRVARAVAGGAGFACLRFVTEEVVLSVSFPAAGQTGWHTCTSPSSSSPASTTGYVIEICSINCTPRAFVCASVSACGTRQSMSSSGGVECRCRKSSDEKLMMRSLCFFDDLTDCGPPLLPPDTQASRRTKHC